MAYNHASEEKKWKKEKDKEEKKLRKAGMKVIAITKLRDYDRKEFNAERRYREREQVTSDIFFETKPTYDAILITSIDDLIEHINNEKLYTLLRTSNSILLSIVKLLYDGYTVKEITAKLHMSENAVYKRIQKLRNKIDKLG